MVSPQRQKLGVGLLFIAVFAGALAYHHTVGQDVSAVALWLGTPLICSALTESAGDSERPTGAWLRWTPRIATGLFAAALILSVWGPFFSTRTSGYVFTPAAVLGAAALLAAFPWFCVAVIWGFDSAAGTPRFAGQSS